MSGKNSRWWLSCLILALVCDSASAAGKSKGYVLSRLTVASYAGADDCPKGLSLDVLTSYLTTVSPAERERLSKVENERELTIKATGNERNQDVCTFPTLFKRPPWHPVQGKISYGMNLDGVDTEEDFITPEGERGIDHELYRITGCHTRYRPGGTPAASKERAGSNEESHVQSIRNGEMTILLEITGIDNERNDSEVAVGLYTGVDTPLQDSLGNLIPHSTQKIVANKKWHNSLRGRIENGVLITEPAEIRLRLRVNISYTEHYFHAARFRLEMLPDGNLKGMLAGYRDIETLYGQVPRSYARAVATVSKLDCPAYYAGLYQYADGPVNPATGTRDSISSAYDVEAVPAFIVQPDGSMAAR